VIDMNTVVGSEHLLLITLDTLRYDAAVDALAAGRTPNLARLLPGGTWERRHTPGSFTYAAHAAFFAGFLPTPEGPGPHVRPFALAFDGSTTVGPSTCVLDGPDIVSGLRSRGYHTICVGGVGFFNRRTPLSRVFPALFDVAHWDESTGVTELASFDNQVAALGRLLAEAPSGRPLFVFLNVAAVHQPNCIYEPGVVEDSPRTQQAALAAVDRSFPALVSLLAAQGSWHVIACSDHGTAYGEDGFAGHRLAHEVVWTVPYAEFRVAAA
jgi:hypothetical protein